jgi:hypothetical protein
MADPNRCPQCGKPWAECECPEDGGWPRRDAASDEQPAPASEPDETDPRQ